jgi:hypothetical protein
MISYNKQDFIHNSVDISSLFQPEQKILRKRSWFLVAQWGRLAQPAAPDPAYAEVSLAIDPGLDKRTFVLL